MPTDPTKAQSANSGTFSGSAVGAQLGVPSAGGSITAEPHAKRETFGLEELPIVLSHYDLGPIRTIKEFPRGSRKAPKLLIDAHKGAFLLKRRAKGRDDAAKVAFTHAIQLQLAQKQYPLPHLIGTRTDGNSMLQLSHAHFGGIYEIFEYIPGQSYQGSLDATDEAGRVLALYHKLLEDFTTEFPSATGSYHNAAAVTNALSSIAKHSQSTQLADLCQRLRDSYEFSAEVVEAHGYSHWPRQVIHADWHPGNMLFRDQKVVAVIDYDSARILPRAIDTANGALQFSIIGNDENLATWPESLDESRFKRFVRGYDQVVMLSEAELHSLPHLMIQALIAEAVFPILATGKFARFDGGDFLSMVRRKTTWLSEHAEDLVKLVAE
jgi:Ser/Thr protein kinase RdoA (MazF antagonist)